jgi:hypothetical protein
MSESILIWGKPLPTFSHILHIVITYIINSTSRVEVEGESNSPLAPQNFSLQFKKIKLPWQDKKYRTSNIMEYYVKKVSP